METGSWEGGEGFYRGSFKRIYKRFLLGSIRVPFKGSIGFRVYVWGGGGEGGRGRGGGGGGNRACKAC